MYIRYFYVDAGPIWDRFTELCMWREQARKAISALAKELGADDVRGDGPSNYVFVFSGANLEEVKQSLLWSKVPGYAHAYRPNKRCRALYQRVQDLPIFPTLNEAIRVVGLYPGVPVLIEDRCGHSPWIYFYSVKAHFLIVAVPWRDVDEAKMKAYQRKRKQGVEMDAEMDYLAWKPHQSMREIKEWEALKMVDERINSKGGVAA